MTPLEAARHLTAAGLSVIPIKPDGSKAPDLKSWKPFQSRIATENEQAKFFANGNGIAILGGKISGNLEILDIESAAPFSDLLSLIREHLPELSLPHVQTPTGGHHLFWRCDVIASNQKLAMSHDDNVLIETRGEGGYVVTITSPPGCHPSGKTYELVSGRLTVIPTISADDREIILSCCRSFNQRIQETFQSPKPNGHGLRPGDDYNSRGDALAVLQAHGWRITFTRGETAYLRRPGKDSGVSATYGHVAPRVFYVFSSNATPFDFGRAYDAFGIYSRLEHAGDLPAATRALGKLGYGEPAEKPKTGKHLKPPNGMPAGTEAVKSGIPRVTSNSWTRLQLDLTYKGSPVINMNNVVKVMQADARLENLVWYDDFLQRLLTEKPARAWTDTDDAKLLLYLQNQIGLSRMGMTQVREAIQVVAMGNRRNCVKDWLSRLKWDGEPRIAHFFADHFGAVRTTYTSASAKNFWISMVARVFKPGCQVDNMIVLEAKQGARKSSAMRIIGGEWYTEQHESATNPKAFAEILQGKLLVEIGELDSFSRSEVTRVKQVVTCTSDRFRVPFSRYAEDHPRQCVFVGTTNRDDWNHDDTGARRFWPIRCTDIDCDSIAKYRAQFFAEACQQFTSGASWWDMPEFETAEEQIKRYDDDPWAESIADFVKSLPEVTSNQILSDLLKLAAKDVTRREQMRVATCLRSLGWTSTVTRIPGVAKVRRTWLPSQD